MISKAHTITIVTLLLSFQIILAQQQANKTSKAEFNLSPNEIHYIYNRAFDLALRDSRNEIMERSILLNRDYINFDTILITIDPYFNPNAFNLMYIEELNNIKFDGILNVQNTFNDISIINSFQIKYQHYNTTPPLIGNHFMHVTFSNLYMHNNFLYLGVKTESQISIGGGHNFPEFSIFKLEWCNNKFTLFRNMYVPLGSSGYKDSFFKKELDDYHCY